MKNMIPGPSARKSISSSEFESLSVFFCSSLWFSVNIRGRIGLNGNNYEHKLKWTHYSFQLFSLASSHNLSRIKCGMIMQK